MDRFIDPGADLVVKDLPIFAFAHLLMVSQRHQRLFLGIGGGAWWRKSNFIVVGVPRLAVRFGGYIQAFIASPATDQLVQGAIVDAVDSRAHVRFHWIEKLLKIDVNPAKAGSGDTFICTPADRWIGSPGFCLAGRCYPFAPPVCRPRDQKIRCLPKKWLKFKTIANRFNILLGNNDILLEY
jgi:hypothetical protein